MTDADEPVPPSWVLRTPVRAYEWWARALFMLIAGIALGVLSVQFDASGAPRVAGITAAALTVAGAVVYGVAARRAYDAQEIGASWRLHTNGVVVGCVLVTVLVLLGVAAPGVVTASIFPGLFVIRYLGAVPLLRFDLLARMTTSAVVAVAIGVLALIGLLVPTFPDSALWQASSLVIPVLVGGIMLDRHRLRTAPER
ncbi:hypothetical protein [Curtobacterium sp. RRHDQ10]|uniref:hypothetical protein n=1 Tax=Curtobacterium phyllosphaerae TaxID=3413379 RepID=UPI003BF00E2C